MRKAMNAPITGAEDLLLLALVTMVALSIPLGARTGAHIEIEILEPSMSALFAKWSMIFIKILGASMLGFMGWRLWHAGGMASKFGETTQQLLISFEPFYYLLSVSILIYALVLVLDIWQILQSQKVNSATNWRKTFVISLTLIGILGLLSLFILLALRMPVALSMLSVGFIGTIIANAYKFMAVGMAEDQAWSRGLKVAYSNLAGETFEAASNYNLLVIPMFVLMGNLAGVSGMSKDLFSAAYRWMGHLRGGLASATIAACAGFAALSGSSLASAVTMGRVALPEMKKYKYADSLATGSVAAGGTLGFLIPPSGGMIIYAVLTEQSIGRLFMAGVFPGIILTLLFIGAIYCVVIRNPTAGPRAKRFGRPERVTSLWRALPIVGVVLITIGGMYTGFFTPVEASSVGAFLTFVVAAYRQSLGWQASKAVILETMNATATVFLIIIGAFVFIPFMSLTELPAQLVTILTSLPIGNIGILLIIVLIYMFLGMFLEAIAMLVLTIPVVIPIAVALDWDLIWFGIILVIVLEMGMISPPVGINVFIVKSIARDVPMSTIFRGIWPFWFAMAAMIGLLILFPQIALYLPQAVVGG